MIASSEQWLAHVLLLVVSSTSVV
uniref:Uncharacterized protein n=1 Tax=Arundo donax TaxID=35708 RepID=A0A0A9BB46_ARUDO